MNCKSCGQPLFSDSRFCARCGSPAPGSDQSHGGVSKPLSGSRAGRRGALVLFAGLALVVVGIGIFAWLGNDKEHDRSATAAKTSRPAKDPVSSDSGGVLNGEGKAAREAYVSRMRDQFRNDGVEASISDLEGNLIIVSDDLRIKPDRDKMMRTTFDAAYRKSLCAMGFRTVELRSGIVFGDGDTYSLGCPETKEEKDARWKAESEQRRAFVDQLQQSFKNDPDIGGDIHVEQGTDELILTGSSAKDVPPQVLRSMFAGDDSSERMCGIGFRGLRVRSDVSSKGTFMSFNCGKRRR